MALLHVCVEIELELNSEWQQTCKCLTNNGSEIFVKKKKF